MPGPRDVEQEETDRVLLTQFDQRRNILVNHLYLFHKKGNISGLNKIYSNPGIGRGPNGREAGGSSRNI